MCMYTYSVFRVLSLCVFNRVEEEVPGKLTEASLSWSCPLESQVLTYAVLACSEFGRFPISKGTLFPYI